ncbi:hypothetical protein PVAND_007448 [Polypedilum vanderplanki]|uniref:Titin-like n=1 Tax=Polypedilum vanderplanki TaxID=319348 RepID=A0A9J6C6B9_POLVA|nr:hypothetical protein PVAND_007448 [Polypedilum vanderplanki]
MSRSVEMLTAGYPPPLITQLHNKRVIKKKSLQKQRLLKSYRFHEQIKEPQTTVIIKEEDIPEEEIESIATYEYVKEKTKPSVEEIPDDVKISEVISEEKAPEKSVKKRTFTKKIGKKQEITEIVTVEESNKEPQTTVTVSEITLDTDTTQDTQDLPYPIKPRVLETQQGEIDIKITEHITETSEQNKKIHKRIIKKKIGKKQEITEIVTIHEENKEPQTTVTTTVTIKEEDIPVEELQAIETDQFEKLKTKKTIEEIPSDVKISEIVYEESTPDKSIKKRVIKKKVDHCHYQEEDIPVEELQAIETDQFEKLKTKKTIEEIPSDVKISEIVTEESTPDKSIKKRVIKKKVGKKQEITEIVTVEESNKEPQTTVTIKEEDIPVEELQAIETDQFEKLKTKKTIERNTFRFGKKQEITEIVTVEESNKEPQTTVTIKEEDIPVEELQAIETDQFEKLKTKKTIEEIPSDVKISEIVTEEFTPDKSIKKRVIKKKVGKKQEITEIVTLQAIETDQFEKLKTKKTIEEIPSDVKISEIVTEESTPDKSIKKRVIKKKVGKKQEITEIVTVEESNKEPQTTVTIKEEDIPVEELQAIETDQFEKLKTKKTIEEIPSDVKISEIVTEESTPDKSIKKRVIKKKVAKNKRLLKLLQLRNQNKEPQTTVTIKEEDIPVEELQAIETDQFEKLKTKKTIEEIPSDVKISEIVTEESTPDKSIKKRVIKKKVGKKQEITEIVTVEESNKEPQTTVTIKEEDIPVEELQAIETDQFEKLKTKKTIEEYLQMSRSVKLSLKESTPDKSIKKRVIKKKVGKKQEITEIVTVEESNKEPQTTVTIKEEDIPVEELQAIETDQFEKLKTKKTIEEIPSDVKISEIVMKNPLLINRLRNLRNQIKNLRPLSLSRRRDIPVEELQAIETDQFEKLKTKKTIEEIPSDVKISEIVTEESTPDKSIKKRVIKKKVGKKQEITEIVTVEESNKEPQTTVTIKEEDIPVEELQAIETDQFEKLKTKKTIEEIPSDVKISEIVTEESTPDKSIKKRVIKKKVGKKQEITEIVTVEESNKEPQTTVTIKEEDIPVEELQAIETDQFEKLKTKKTIEEIPSDKVGKKQEITEIVTVEESNKEPQTTVTIKEEDIPVEELQAIETDQFEKLKIRKLLKKYLQMSRSVKLLQRIEESNKEPQTTVTIKEEDIPVEELQAIETDQFEKLKTKKTIEEIPSDVKISEIVQRIEESIKEPQTTVTIKEEDIPVEELQAIETDQFEKLKTKKTIEENTFRCQDQ